MAITRAQQVRQMLRDGGVTEDISFSIVKPSKDGKRPGYFSGLYGGGAGDRGGDPYGSASENQKAGRTDEGNRQRAEDYRRQQSQTTTPTTPVKKPIKKPKKTKDNSTKSNVVTNYLENNLLSKGVQAAKNSKFVASLNARQREQYLENLKEEDNELYQQTVDDLAKLGYATRDVELYGPESKGAGRDIEIFTDLGEDQAKSILNTVVDNNEGGVGTLYDDYLDSRNTSLNTPTGGGDDQVIDPCKGPNPPAYCFVDDKKEEEVINPRDYTGLAPRFMGSSFDFTGLAEGGRVAAQQGGIMSQQGGIMPRLNDLSLSLIHI